MPPAASSCWLSWQRWKMADLLTAHLPDSWHGRRIDPDFRHMVRLSNAYAHGRLDGEHPEEALAIMERFYHKPVPPEQLPDAYGCMVDFTVPVSRPQQALQVNLTTARKSRPLSTTSAMPVTSWRHSSRPTAST